MYWRRSGGGKAVKSRNGFAVALGAVLMTLAFGPVAVADASIVIESPANDSTSHITLPTISGSTTDGIVTDQVSVAIHEGISATGPLAQPPATTSPTLEGTWSLEPESALTDGTYTAVAEQTELLSGETSTSSPVTFTVDTAPPSVKLNKPESPSKNTQPSFTGSASDTTTVTVDIYHGAHASGGIVSEATAGGTGAGFITGEASPELETGEYTAVAVQESSLGNGPGKSNEVTFKVDTTSPKVTLNQPESPSKNTQPSFTGSASDTTTVTVDIYHGSHASGGVASEATASSSGGNFSTNKASPALESGEYTAVAIQPSSLGNPPGESKPVTFIVNTTSPKVTLNKPESPSKNRQPSFTGSASDTTTVTVDIYHGSHASGGIVSEATAGGTGAGFITGEASPELETGEYTAIAIQPSSLGNPAGESNEVTFKVDTTSPKVTLDQPESPSKNTQPSFTGSASDTTTVTVQVYAGTEPKGLVRAEATATGTGGPWTSGAASPALASGTYTAVATQPSSLGNGPGVSEAVTFSINTAAPHVTLNQPKTPSDVTTPSFSGSASDTTPVMIEIHSGSGTGGPVVAHAQATGTGGSFGSGQASPALESGTYTAVATQASSLGNPTGVSNAVVFVVDTSSPTVTIEQPAPLSNNPKPTLSGTATDTTKVIVHIFNASDEPVTTASATPSAGHWSTSGEEELQSGAYSAVATQESSLGNPQGESAHVSFTVNTEPPKLTLNSPPLRSNNQTPSFSGTTSDTELVVVHVYEGTKPEGKELASAGSAVSGGSFATGAVSPALAAGVHTYTAVATEKSSLGNPAGKSNTVTFTVDTSSPTVTLNQPASPSKDTTPTFTGSSSETTTVAIKIFAGEKAEGSVIATAEASGTGGAWSSTEASPALSSGTHKYTAVATQNSLIGNSPGTSAPVTFTVDTTAPKVTLEAPSTPSKNTVPSFTGTASDTSAVTVHVYSGSKVEGAPVASAAATGTGAAWSSSAVTPALGGSPAHTYTAVAEQPSSLGNPTGKSSPVTFEVDTTSPVVTITSPASGSTSNKQTPTFSGTATGRGSGQVKIRILEGSSTGSEVSSATATVSSGKWTSSTASPALATGTHTYVAIATEENPLGNPAGTSEISFTVNTLPPTVTLETPPSPSSETAPVFKGSASDTREVTVRIYEERGKEVSKATAKGTGAAWVSAAASPELPKTEREYKAVAEQPSSLGNQAGKSTPVRFVVDPAAPAVKLNSPPVLSNNTAPAFSGTASDRTPVTVEVRDASGTEVSKASAAGTGGAWSSGPTAPALPDGTYTAQAIQVSTGGHEGGSNIVTFTVDTQPPAVTVISPASGATVSGETQPISGTAGTRASDIQRVAVELFAGAGIAAGQAPVQTIEVPAPAGAWSTAFGGLAAGAYTVRAQQTDQAGNVGISNSVTFTVAPAGGAVALASGPSASFSWLPAQPAVGQAVSLVSSSSDKASPIVGFAWDTTGLGVFSPGGPEVSTTFATPGSHTLRLRVSAADGQSAVAAETIPVGAAALPLMQPFPVVRITSLVTHSGTKVELLSVLAAPGAMITVHCNGHACPTKSAESRRGGRQVEGAVRHLPPFRAHAAPGRDASHHRHQSGNDRQVDQAARPPPQAPAAHRRLPERRDHPAHRLSREMTPLTSTRRRRVRGMTIRLAGMLAVVSAIVASAPGLAQAATPVLTITSPTAGDVSNNQMPTIEGTGSEPELFCEAVVKVSVSAGGEPVGQPLETVPLPDGSWSVSWVEPLKSGTYQAVAEETFTCEGTPPESGTSQPVTFTVDTTPPQVTLSSPAAGAFTGSSVTASGHAGSEAGDLPAVKVQLYAGTSPGGEPLAALTVQRSGESWSATFAGLTPGVYTLRAVQFDRARNEGVSAPITFTVGAPPPAPTPAPPTASFTWVPSAPHVGEPVTLISDSTDPGAPITSLAWSVGAGAAFAPGGALFATSFAAPGAYVTQLRVSDAKGRSAISTQTIHVTASPLVMMQPFPVVRIVGRLTGSGARLTLLSVQAPLSALVTVTCRGRSCPAHVVSHVATAPKHKPTGGVALISFRRFARTLHAGVVLEIRVTKAGEIGKYTRFLIRRTQVPARSDDCLWPSSKKPANCPS